jgi:hypothetical protein
MIDSVNPIIRSSPPRDQALPPLKNARQVPISDPQFSASRKHGSQMSDGYSEARSEV